MMSKSFNILKNKMSLKAQQAAIEKADKMLAEMPLQELRQAKNLSQERLAKILTTKREIHINQFKDIGRIGA